MKLGARIASVLTCFFLMLSLISCGTDDKGIDVEKYRDKVRESRQKEGAISPENRESILKKIFPNYKGKD